MVLKSKIHQLVDACEDDSKLEAVEALLQESSKTDWWQLLPEHEKSKTLASLQQANKGKTTSHQQLIKTLRVLKVSRHL